MAPRYRTSQRPSLAALSVIPLLTAAQNLPYNPTRIHLSSQPDGKNRAFIIQPGTDSSVSAQLSVLDLSDTISASAPSPKALSSSLPFLSSNAATAYTSFIEPGGNITVLAGDCTSGVTGAALWRLAPDASAQNGGTWTKDTILSPGSSSSQTGVTGANFLGTGVAFSELVGANASSTDLYAFGGMCPSPGASSADWTTQAVYNNDMVNFSPQTSSSLGGGEEYSIAPVTSKGPPIAEAGMSMTPLSPTYSNSSGLQTQQQDFVVLGGHTQSAFINMSQVALFSLPQASWSFLPVEQPDGATSVSSAGYVTPRSGHTAVLSEDGRSIVVYGGWVGDVNTPASPQLVVLDIGSGYGGSGDWRWTPVATPSGSFSGAAGIYGHGAVMLPGNVMMVMGGYTITTSATRRFSRRDGAAQNTKTFLYNLTSNAWLAEYSAPAESTSAQSSGSSSGNLGTPSQKAGVGIGVTFGVFALAGAGTLYALKGRRGREKRRRLNRDSTGMQLVEDKSSFDEGWSSHTLTGGKDTAYTGYDAGSPTKESFPWLPEIGQSRQAAMRDVGVTGAFLNIPSPTRGLRRSTSGRNYQYSPTPHDEPRAPINGIHPIVEEDNESTAGDERSVKTRLIAPQNVFDSRTSTKRPRTSDSDNPFGDSQAALSPLGSNPVSPELGDMNKPGSPFRAVPVLSPVRTSARDWAPAPSGRSSPTKSINDDRTSSTLSDQSSRSYQSARSMARSGSNRSPTYYAYNSFTSRPSPLPSPSDELSSFFDPNGRRSPRRNRSVTSPVSHRVSDPAETGLHIPRPASSLYSHDDGLHLPPSSPPRPAAKKMNWVGSLRRALGTYISPSTPEPPMTIPEIPIPASYTDRSLTPSPVRRSRPQRTASDSSTFLRLKRGQEDWNASGGNAWEPYRDEPDGGDWGVPPSPSLPLCLSPGKPGTNNKKRPAGPRSMGSKERDEGGEEWDVENAARERDVQIMFTVPKARLRVVNAGPGDGGESLRSVSGGSGGRSPDMKVHEE